MNQLSKRARLGLALLAIGALGAVGAPGASAATTAYECGVPHGGAGFSDGHCLHAASGGGNVKFEHRLIPAGTTTIAITNKETASATTAATPAVLEANIIGVIFKFECTKATGSGTMFNGSIGAEMVIVGEGVITFSSCTVANPDPTCQIAGGLVETSTLTATTAGQGAAIKISPKAASFLATITLGSCSSSTLNGNYPVTGSLKISPLGATGTTTHGEITGQGTLKLLSHTAGLSASFLVRGVIGGEETFPLVAT